LRRKYPKADCPRIWEIEKLAQEISESMLRPRIWEIEKLFEEEYFKEKFVLQVI
jgi:hypothetical protein